MTPINGTQCFLVRIVADLFEHPVDTGLINVIFKLLKGAVPLFVSKPHVPAVGRGIVVITPLLFMDVDPCLVDQAVGRSAGVRGTGPGGLGVEKVETSASGTS